MPVGSRTEVTFKGADGLVLQGTLLRPENKKGSTPAVLLLPGSGPTDRDGNQLPTVATNLLKEFAETLASNGFATIRFDKRATKAYAAFFPKDVKAQNDFFAWDKFVGDAKGALRFLSAQKGVDPKRLFIIGHSEGSMIAGQIGHDLNGKSGCPAGLVLMGAPGRPLGPVIREQVLASLNRAKMSAEAQKPYVSFLDEAITLVSQGKNPPPNPPLGMAALFPPSAIKLMQSYFTNDPAMIASAFSGPVLIVQGQKDIQVLAKKDTPRLLAALKARKKGHVEAFVVPSASHNLKQVNNENVEPGFTGPVAPLAIEKVVSWLKARSK